MNAEAVRNESRNVACDDDPFAEEALAEGSHTRDDVRARALGGDELEQVQIPRWIEEVRSEEPSPKRVGPRFDERADRNGRRIRRHDRRRFDDRLELLEQLPL